MEFNLAEVHETVAATNPDRECIVWRDKRLTYGQVTERTRRLANGLLAAGLGLHRERGELAGHESGQDHLALYLYNGNEYLEGMLGAYKARVAPFNVNYRYVEEELRYLLADSDTKAIIYHAAFAPVLEPLRSELDLRLLLQVADDSGNELLDGAIDYEEFLASSPYRSAPTSSGRPMTSTCFTPVGRPACPRACCGASTTSSWPRWAAAASGRARCSRRSRRSSRPRRAAAASTCPCPR